MAGTTSISVPARLTVVGSAVLVAGGVTRLALWTTPFPGHLVGLVAARAQTRSWHRGAEALALLALIAAHFVLAVVLAGRRLAAARARAGPVED